jgi:methylmalonyl-CoA mutase N-terminal domain/subunit
VIPPGVEDAQRARVARTRADRDPGAAAVALEALAAAAGAPDAELIEPLLVCARARCTEGEIVSTLRWVFGGWREDPRF